MAVESEEVAVTLSGLNDEKHIIENVKLTDEIKVGCLTKEELDIYKEVKDEYLRLMKVPCTGCCYCLPCPVGVNIPFAFNYYNSRYFFNQKLLFLNICFLAGMYWEEGIFLLQIVLAAENVRRYARRI